jgi:alkaline phosphatase
MRPIHAVLAGAVLVGVATALPGAEEAAPALPHSVVLVIGDGTGWQQWGLYVTARRAAGEKERSAFHRLAAGGVVGSMTTWASDSLVTDSAAGATALASGVKTKNGVDGMDAEGKSVPTCLEAAAARGMWTGVLTTTAVTDATPACFCAHVPSRRLMTQVAEQEIRDHDLHVILGGGTMFFLPRTKPCSAAGEMGRGIADGPSQRRDEVDLVAEAKAKGFAVATNRKALLEGPAPDRLLGLFAPYNLPYLLDRDEPEEAEAPSLAEMTARALEVLGKSDKGFFLMVEAGRVDHACHNNDAGAALGEMRELDATLEILLRLREAHPDLLVVLTADHETGGLSVASPKGEQLDAEMIGRLGTQRRSLEAVSAEVGGATAPVEAARVAVPWLPERAVALSDPAQDGRGPFLGRSRRPYADAASGGAGVVFSTDGHTATPVPVVAAGPGAERFAGLHDNTEIGRALIDLLSGR